MSEAEKTSKPGFFKNLKSELSETICISNCSVRIAGRTDCRC